MKNKSILLFCIIISISFISQGCSKKAESIATPKQSNPKKTESAVKTSQKYFSPYTGEAVKKELLDNIAVLVVVENSVAARPQSGLNAADIVYETMAEGGTPRFIALFQKNNAEKVGPIRSARPYFLDISKEYNLPFAHCGGSSEALVKIKNENLMSMNEMTHASTYWRDSLRKTPHNLYTSTEKLRELVKRKDFVKAPTVKLKFDKGYWDNAKSPKAIDVLLKINKNYNTGYNYKDGLYLKSMDGKSSTNKENKLPLAFKTIVVQITSIKKQADGQHLDISLVGKGDGYVISNGKFIKMHWAKKDATSQTLLTDEGGNNLPLNPGKTCWNIVDKNTIVDIN
ncbi:DUF3048 domain-containing protein [Clostridium sp. CF011]|uniref:DUF3048 domain-containing protein n=1 Tax=Clostridium sp. CF011 TaxID=2843318 RepID=UPI001C0A98E1|nr:DUF3048 domain-containing protein [Clostridium sp. CF011]MBU3092401.1 DUF3048 domain-containing protein [Clostridium sp. CF011]WAG68412.1 DUF3048 domain-containing protein [Clostridium sp. CF011]